MAVELHVRYFTPFIDFLSTPDGSDLMLMSAKLVFSNSPNDSCTMDSRLATISSSLIRRLNHSSATILTLVL